MPPLCSMRWRSNSKHRGCEHICAKSADHHGKHHCACGKDHK